jgi:hypothetical protein
VRLPGFEGPISQVRVDPSSLADQEVQLHGVRVLRGDDELFGQRGRELASWAVLNADVLAVGPDGLSISTTTTDPMVMKEVEPFGSPPPAAVRTLQRWLATPVAGATLVLALPLAVLLFGATWRRPAAVAVAVMGPLAAVLAAIIVGQPAGRTDSSEAFGQAGWDGLDANYGLEFLLVACALVAVMVGSAVLGSWLWRRLRTSTSAPLATGPTPDPDDTPPWLPITLDDPLVTAVHAETPVDPLPDRRRVRSLRTLRRAVNSRWAVILAVPIVYLLTAFPSVRATAQSLTMPLPPGNLSDVDIASWDRANLSTWDHFFANGLVPMQDFWYPYGNLIVLRAGVVGTFLEWLGRVVGLLAVSAALWRLGRRGGPVIVGTAAVAVAMHHFTWGVRYLYPLAAILFFAVTRRQPGWERWLARIAVGLAPLLALDVGLYTLLGAVAAVTLDELTVRNLGNGRVRERIIPEIAVIAAGLLVTLGYLIMIGGLGASIDFIFDGSTTSYVAGYMRPIRDLLEETPVVLYVVLPISFVAVALWAAARPRGRSAEDLWVAALGGVATYGLMMLAKHLTRPSMEGTIVMSLCSGVAVLLASGRPPLGRLIRPVAAGTMAGAMLLQFSARLDDGVRSVIDVPGEIGQALDGLTSERASTPWLHVNLGPSQLQNFGAERAAAEAIRTIAPQGRIFVLGDAQYLYPLVDSDPYWMISMYDMSPVAEQQRVIDLLEDDPPAVVVLDTTDRTFDRVPSVLRTPLAYQWVIDRFQLDRSVGQYDLLTPRPEGEPIDWRYWRRTLGTDLDLGRLPFVTSGEHPACDEEGPCVTYLRSAAEPVDVLTTRELTLRTSNGPITMSFEQWPGETEFVIPLGRLWFWTDDPKASVEPAGWLSDVELVEFDDTGYLY